MKGSDIVIAVVALILFAAFLAVMIWKVPSVDLIIVCLIGFGLAAFDFWRTARRNRPADHHRRSAAP